MRSVVMASAISLGLGSCVFDPYIKSPLPKDVTCDSKQDPKDANDGVAYAACTRKAMEAKAGTYALMNNAGAAFLMNLAGLAAYRAFRGGNEANVAALTIGGAALFGTQQYLYRKPREAIYFAGSATIGCAIGITRHRTSVRPAELRNELAASVDIAALNAALGEVRRLETREPNAQCPIGVRNLWKEASDSVAGASGSASIVAIQNRIVRAEQHILRLGDVYRNANDDLITVTDAVRASVNHQLTQEQPDPAQIALSIASLKLAPLQGLPPSPASTTAAKAAEVEDESRTNSAQASLRSLAYEGRNILAESRCNVSSKDVDAFANAVRIFIDDRSTANEVMAGFERRMADIETNAQGSVEGLRKDCPIGVPPAIVPFALKPLQEGPQVMTQGGTLLIPFEGGIGPYKIIAIAAEKADTLTGTASETLAGDRRFEVKAAADAKVGVYSMIANDAAGGVKVVQIEIKATPEGG